MKKELIILCLFLAEIPLQTPQAADTANSSSVMVTNYHSALATIKEVNRKDRKLTLTDAEGGDFTVQVGTEVRNFDQIKQGDEVVVEYRAAAVSKLQKVDKMTSATSAEMMMIAPEGEKPGMATAETRPIVAKVMEVDHENRVLTLQGPGGRFVIVKVPAEMKAFDDLQPGDKVSAQYTEAMAISVRTPEK